MYIILYSRRSFFFFFSSRRRHTRLQGDWSSDVCSSDLVRRFGNKANYGDASRVDLLRAAGAADAKLIVIAVDNKEKALEIAEVARKEFPQLKVLARAFDRGHLYELM